MNLVEFKLSNLVNAVDTNNGYNVKIKRDRLNEGQTLKVQWEVFPAGAKYLIEVTTPEGKKYSFKDTYKKDKEIIIRVSDIPSNDQHIKLLSKLNIPCNRV